jgi:hypothetical protein
MSGDTGLRAASMACSCWREMPSIRAIALRIVAKLRRVLIRRVDWWQDALHRPLVFCCRYVCAYQDNRESAAFLFAPFVSGFMRDVVPGCPSGHRDKSGGRGYGREGRNNKGVPYEFEDAHQLLSDFFADVDRILQEV